LALSVPLSRFRSQVGGGSAFFVRPTRHRVNRKIPKVVVVAILGPILIVMACWILFGDTSIGQAGRIKLAVECSPTINSAVHSHPEFSSVIIQPWTGAGGCLSVVGRVETEKQRADLQDIIAATKPPVKVVYNIKVIP